MLLKVEGPYEPYIHELLDTIILLRLPLLFFAVIEVFLYYEESFLLPKLPLRL